MESVEEQLSHLRRLAAELARHEFRAEVVTGGRRPYLQVANPDVRELSERVVCQPASDGTWCFLWSWRHLIGTVDDIGMAARRIMTVLRSVDGR